MVSRAPPAAPTPDEPARAPSTPAGADPIASALLAAVEARQAVARAHGELSALASASRDRQEAADRAARAALALLASAEALLRADTSEAHAAQMSERIDRVVAAIEGSRSLADLAVVQMIRHVALVAEARFPDGRKPREEETEEMILRAAGVFTVAFPSLAARLEIADWRAAVDGWRGSRKQQWGAVHDLAVKCGIATDADSLRRQWERWTAR
jgi:hypothetical protein